MEKIICSNGYSAKVSFNEKDKNIIFDLDIEKYTYMSENGWQEKKFPSNIVFNDKLYLSSDNIIDIIHCFDCLLNNCYISHPKMKTTSRGFSYLDLKDLKNNSISIQDSSSNTPCIWFGVEIDLEKLLINDNGVLKHFNFNGLRDVMVKDRLHLGIEETKKLKFMFLKNLHKMITPFDIHNLNYDKKNEIILYIFKDLDSNLQQKVFESACNTGNIDIVKFILNQESVKFTKDINLPIEEHGLISSMHPESKDVLKLLKQSIKEKNIELSFDTKKWISENKLGRKIKI